MKTFSQSFILFLILSCGKDGNHSTQAPDSPTIVEEQVLRQEDAGQYRVVLSTLNTQIPGNETTGNATIDISADSFAVKVRTLGAPVGNKSQSIHMPGACPTESNDSNGDGIIDASEAQSAYGLNLIPLDSDLNEQQVGENIDLTGSYNYSEEASLSSLLADLYTVLPEGETRYKKLATNEFLNLAGRQLVIYGVSSSIPLPDSVGTINNQPPEATLPIACGTIRRIEIEE